jgi:hypothetical protein
LWEPAQRLQELANFAAHDDASRGGKLAQSPTPLAVAVIREKLRKAGFICEAGIAASTAANDLTTSF